MERKYRKSTFEPETFDADGLLTDRRLTARSARAMLDTLKQAFPAIPADVELQVTYRKTRCIAGAYQITRVTDVATGARSIESRLIKLHHVGQREKTLLHEAAHAMTEGQAHGPVWQEACLTLEAFWRQHQALPKCHSTNDQNEEN